MAEGFELGSLVWAKMKGFSFWPAKITRPPSNTKPSTVKKPQHFVFFFGTNNCAWIPHSNIVHHSEQQVENALSKKISPTLRNAVDRIIEESLKIESPKKGKKKNISCGEIKKEKNEFSKSYQVKSEFDAKKPGKSSKVKRAGTNIGKRTVKKCKTEELLPDPKISKMDDSFSDLFANITSNLNTDSRVAVIKPYDDKSASSSQSFGGIIAKRDYFSLPAADPLEMKLLSELMQMKNIVPTSKRIGFLGLGNMGQRIVKNLLLTGHRVTIWNRSTEKCQPFEDIGALVVLTPADVVANADIIFSCVSDSNVVESLVLGNCGIVKGLEGIDKGEAKSKGYVEMTTIDPNTSKKIANAIICKGGQYLEAPIIGSRTLAEDGMLLIVAAGDHKLYIDCESCFHAISKTTYYLGKEVGSGSKMSLVSNTLLGTAYAALAEALVLAESLGLSPSNFLEILQLGPLNCDVLLEKGRAMCDREFRTDTSLKYIQQDLCMTLLMGAPTNQPMHVTAAANNLYKHAELLRYSEHDVAAVYFGAKY